MSGDGKVKKKKVIRADTPLRALYRVTFFAFWMLEDGVGTPYHLDDTKWRKAIYRETEQMAEIAGLARLQLWLERRPVTGVILTFEIQKLHHLPN